MKHFLATGATALALLSLCSFASSSISMPEVARGFAATANPTSGPDDDQGESITGAFHLWGMSGGYIYFSLNGIPIRMLESKFPNPIPPNGKIMTATGCTLDSDGGYTCTGIQ